MSTTQVETPESLRTGDRVVEKFHLFSSCSVHLGPHLIKPKSADSHSGAFPSSMSPYKWEKVNIALILFHSYVQSGKFCSFQWRSTRNSQCLSFVSFAQGNSVHNYSPFMRFPGALCHPEKSNVAKEVQELRSKLTGQ